MARGGKRSGAGRKKGSTGERTQKKRDLIDDAIRRELHVKDPGLWLWRLNVKHAQSDPVTARWLAEQRDGRAPLAIKGDLDLTIRREIYRCVDDQGKDSEPGGGD